MASDDAAAGDHLTADLTADLALAHAVADAADRFTLSHFIARDFSVDWKTNQTEVTEVDREAESLIVEHLVSERPAHAVFGEEHGLTGDPDAEWRWVIDPIDGTSGFVRGIPIWGSLIALTHRGEAVLGVVSAPALDRRWWGGVGLGAHLRELGTTRRIEVSRVGALAEAQVSITHNQGWERLGLTENLLTIERVARRTRCLGDFWQHMLVAEGAMDVAVDAVGVAPYDIAALKPIVEAAGGQLTDRFGVATHQHDTAISTNGHLHAEILRALTP